MARSQPPAVDIHSALDDLAFVAADAVLRPANDRLEPVTPAMVRLDRQGGERLAAQRRVSLPLDAGAAVVTGGGELTASFVVHVVVQSADRPVSRETVRRGLVSAWQRAAEWGLSTLAAPLVGAGPGQLGAEEATRLLVETFRDHGGRPDWPRRLTIVVEREDERALVAAVLRSELPC